MITYISGGTRSGKSRYAQQRALALSSSPVYIATARVWDDEFASRVQRHQADRGQEWTTYETCQHLYRLPLANEVVVIDCVTLWLANYYAELPYDEILPVFQKEIDELVKLSGIFFVISNEIGMGLHADSQAGRKFTDLQGWANQYVASVADEAVFMVSGLPLTVKEP